MSGAQMLALSLGLSVAVAALGLAAMRRLEHRLADPAVREQAWGMVLHLSAFPPLMVAILLLLPPQVRGVGVAVVEFDATAGAAPSPGAGPDLTSLMASHGATLVLTIAALLAGVRLIALMGRLLRLRKLLAATTPAEPALRRNTDEIARRLQVSAPDVRVCGRGSEAILAGLRKPVLVLPAALAAAADGPATRAVCAHELAHLKRGDHRSLWLEEAVLSLLAVNPLLSLVRDHRAAAREEACDAAALAGAGDVMRRQYARSLLAALQDPASGRDLPALTFTSARRTFVMRRLKAILAPVAPSGRRPRLVLTGVAVLIGGVAGAGSLAVAAQREPVLVVRPDPAPATATVGGALPAPPAATARAVDPVANPASAPDAREDRAAAPSTALTQVAEPASTAVIANPGWAQYPIPQFPAAAQAEGLSEGRVMVTCTAETDGRLSACSTDNETPAGAGFAEAAIEAAQAARLSPRTMESAMPGSRVTFAVSFRAP